MISEMKDKYRGVFKSPLAPPEINVKAPDPEYIFDVSFTFLFFSFYKTLKQNRYLFYCYPT